MGPFGQPMSDAQPCMGTALANRSTADGHPAALGGAAGAVRASVDWLTDALGCAAAAVRVEAGFTIGITALDFTLERFFLGAGRTSPAKLSSELDADPASIGRPKNQLTSLLRLTFDASLTWHWASIWRRSASLCDDAITSPYRRYF